MQYVVTIELFDGFECNFDDTVVMDANDSAEAERRTRAWFEGRSSKRPYLEGVKVETLQEWITSHAAKF